MWSRLTKKDERRRMRRRQRRKTRNLDKMRKKGGKVFTDKYIKKCGLNGVCGKREVQKFKCQGKR